MNQKTLKNDIIEISHHVKGHLGSISKNMKVFLTNLKGEILIEQQNLDFIDISNQPKGCYIAFLTDLNGGLIKKICVKKE